MTARPAGWPDRRRSGSLYRAGPASVLRNQHGPVV